MKAFFAAALTAVVGCAGAAPREKPVLEPPALPMSREGPSEGESSPVPVGAWSTVSLKGPGSASYQRIDLILHGDGRCLLVGHAAEEARVVSGRCTWADGILTLVRRNGAPLRFGCRREGALLVLTHGNSELRLAAIRP